jgi:hypothetical protein
MRKGNCVLNSSISEKELDVWGKFNLKNTYQG